eukprot:2731-Heterococcus_DN1.PRE.2
MYFLLPDDKPAPAGTTAVTVPASSSYSSSQPQSQHKAAKASSSSNVPVAAAAAAAAAVAPTTTVSIPWQVLVTAAYTSEQLSAQAIDGHGLTIAEIVDWVIQYRPEQIATAGLVGGARDTTTLNDPERRKHLNIGVQRVLNKKGERGEETVVQGRKVNYWKLKPEIFEKQSRKSDAGSGGEGVAV